MTFRQYTTEQLKQLAADLREEIHLSYAPFGKTDRCYLTLCGDLSDVEAVLAAREGGR